MVYGFLSSWSASESPHGNKTNGTDGHSHTGWVLSCTRPGCDFLYRLYHYFIILLATLWGRCLVPVDRHTWGIEKYCAPTNERQGLRWTQACLSEWILTLAQLFLDEVLSCPELPIILQSHSWTRTSSLCQMPKPQRRGVRHGLLPGFQAMWREKVGYPEKNLTLLQSLPWTTEWGGFLPVACFPSVHYFSFVAQLGGRVYCL